MRVYLNDKIQDLKPSVILGVMLAHINQPRTSLLVEYLGIGSSPKNPTLIAQEHDLSLRMTMRHIQEGLGGLLRVATEMNPVPLLSNGAHFLGTLLSLVSPNSGSPYRIGATVVDVEILDLKCDDMRWENFPFPISVRTANCLLAANIYRMSDLMTISDRDLLRLKNMGRKSLGEIQVLRQLYLRHLSEIPTIAGITGWASGPFF